MDILAPLALLARTLAQLQHPAYADAMPEPEPICPYGHPLVPGRILVGWTPCQCPPALTGFRGRGHRTVQCLDCLDHRITTVRYTPEHIGGGHPNR